MSDDSQMGCLVLTGAKRQFPLAHVSGEARLSCQRAAAWRCSHTVPTRR